MQLDKLKIDRGKIFHCYFRAIYKIPYNQSFSSYLVYIVSNCRPVPVHKFNAKYIVRNANNSVVNIFLNSMGIKPLTKIYLLVLTCQKPVDSEN